MIDNKWSTSALLDGNVPAWRALADTSTDPRDLSAALRRACDAIEAWKRWTISPTDSRHVIVGWAIPSLTDEAKVFTAHVTSGNAYELFGIKEQP